MAPGISQDKIVQQLSYSVNSQITDIQNKVRQENKNQQSKENENTEEVNKKRANPQANSNISGITSSPTGSPSGSTRSTEQGIVKPIKVEDIDKEINAITEAIAEISNGIKSAEEALNKELAEIDNKELAESDSSIHDEIYKKKKTKPRLIVGTSDTNYSSDKGGNYRMVLIYDSANNIKFFKDDNPVIIIKNDAVKNEGDYLRFVAKIRECCKQKMREGKKYYFEDYLDDHGFIKKEIDINEIRRKIELLRKKKFGGIQK